MLFYGLINRFNATNIIQKLNFGTLLGVKMLNYFTLSGVGVVTLLQLLQLLHCYRGVTRVTGVTVTGEEKRCFIIGIMGVICVMGVIGNFL